MEKYDPNEPTYPCRVCGRRFVRSSLAKHEPVCKKFKKMSRKVFDSGKQRATGSDITINDVRRAAKEREKLGGQFPRPKTQWKERHNEFMEVVTASKKVDYAIKTGGPLPPPPRTAVPSDYIECQFCGRNFNQTAAERHIPFCKEQSKKGPIRGPLPGKSNTPTRRSLPSQNKSRESSQSRQVKEESRVKTSERRKSETRSASRSRGQVKSASQANEQLPPPPSRRSNSAPRNNKESSHSSRLKTPAVPKTPNSRPKEAPKPRNVSRNRMPSRFRD